MEALIRENLAKNGEQPRELPSELGPLAQILEYPDPTPGKRNVMHFKIPGGGSVIAKAVPWIDPVTNDQTGDPPFAIEDFQTPLTLRADFVSNMEDDPKGRDLVRHPITGEVLKKKLPWYMDEVDLARRNILDLSQFVPGIQVSRGAKVRYASNPDTEFDDPTDGDNLRHFSQNSISRQVHYATRDVNNGRSYRDIQAGRAPHPQHSMQGYEKIENVNTFTLGLNLGGTIVMKRIGGKLVPKYSLDDVWKEHFQDGFPNSRFASVGFRSTRINKTGEISEGMDSSQMQIEFVADTVATMTSIWNNLPIPERRDFAGFTIACGTDTIVETTTYLKMMLGPNCPFSVITVGAMKPTGEESSDAIPNMQKAFEHLHNLHKHDLPLTTVAMRVEGGLYDPTKTRKMHSDKAAAFDGKKLVDTETFEGIQANAHKFHQVQDGDYEKPYEDALVLRCANQVQFVPPGLSNDPFKYEDLVRKSEAKAIVVETYASYTYPTNVLGAIARAANGRPVFVINSIEETGETVSHDYEPTVAMAQLGMYPCRLTKHAITAKINYGLSLFGNNTEQLVDFITKNDFVGEQYKGFQSFPPAVIQRAEQLKADLYEKLGINKALTKARQPEAIASIFDETRAQVSESVFDIVAGEKYSGPSNSDLLRIHAYLEQFSSVQLIEEIKSGRIPWLSRVSGLNNEALQEILEHKQTVKPKGVPIDLERISA